MSGDEDGREQGKEGGTEEGPKSRQKMIDGVHWAAVRGRAHEEVSDECRGESQEEKREERGREREGGAGRQDDLSLPSTDPDAALFPTQPCVCSFQTLQIEILVSQTEQCSELRGKCEKDNQPLTPQTALNRAIRSFFDAGGGHTDNATSLSVWLAKFRKGVTSF